MISFQLHNTRDIRRAAANALEVQRHRMAQCLTDVCLATSADVLAQVAPVRCASYVETARSDGGDGETGRKDFCS